MKKLLMTAGMILGALVSQAALVQMNLSGSYNYDAFVSSSEIAYAVSQPTVQSVAALLGDHSVYYSTVRPGSAYTHLVNPAGANKGIAVDGIIDGGNFELGKGLTDKFGTPTGSVKVNNSVANLVGYGAGVLTRSATITLAAGDQKKYSKFNILVNGNRYATIAGTMSATLSVKYLNDETWYTAWTESVSSGNGGVFGGGYNGDSGANSKQSAAWTQIQVSDDGYATGVINNTIPLNSFAKSGSSYMYKLTTDALLDQTKVLESFKMTAVSYSTARANDFVLYAATGTEVIPEPATVGMLGLGALVTMLIRRLG